MIEEHNKDSIKQNVIDWTIEHIGSNFNFREFQLNVIVDIIYNIVNDKIQTTIVEAPTGSGKSIINIISAGVLYDYYGKTSYILCSDLFLWGQYDKFIKEHKNLYTDKGFATIKGQTGNYTCNLNKQDLREADCRLAQIGWSTLFSSIGQKKYGYTCARYCEYVKARKRAVKAPVVLMTYQLFMYVINILIGNTPDNPNTMMFKQKDVIFCDECHNIPDIVQNQYSAIVRKSDYNNFKQLYDWTGGKEGDLQMSLFDDDNDENNKRNYEVLTKYSRTQLKKQFDKLFNNLTNPNQSNKQDLDDMIAYKELLDDFQDIVNDTYQDISEKKLNKEHISKEELKIHKVCTWFSNTQCFWNDFNTACIESGYEYIIKQISTDSDQKPMVTLNCTKEDYMVYKFLISKAPYRVLTSATVGGKSAFEENIGVRYTKQKSEMYVVPSTFNFNNSPIIFLNKFKMSQSDKERSFPILRKVCYDILQNKFDNVRGIIQTGSYSNAKEIYDNAPKKIKDRMLVYHNAKEKETCIKLHKMMDDSILVGPTLNEGIDLPDDLCRFIIIFKVPYPSLSSRLVRAKQKLFPLWYNSTTSNSIIQGIGRGIRHKNDWCTTYILDACFWYLYVQTKDQYSEQLQNRLKII